MDQFKDDTISNNELKGKKPIKKQALNYSDPKFKFRWYYFVVTLFLILTIYFFITWLNPDIEEVKESVVMVNVYNINDKLIGTGSGFCAFEDNYIITNFHVIEGAYYITITTDDKKDYPINRILIFDSNNDLAIITGDFKLRPLKFGSTNNLKSGQKIATISSPLGELNTVSTGIISNAENDSGIQITASISHGSSGGVLLDKQNKIIGITYATIEGGQNLNYAINLNYLIDMYKAYTNNQYYTIANNENCTHPYYAPAEFYYCSDNGLMISSNNNNFFSVKSNKVFYDITDGVEVFEKLFSTSSDILKNSFNTMNLEKKKQVVDYYNQIIAYTDAYCDNYYDCSGHKDIQDWDEYEAALKMDIIDSDDLSVLLVATESKTNKKDMFNYINSMALGVPQKGMLALLFGGHYPRDLTNNDVNKVVSYINEQSWNVEEKKYVSKMLGFTINGDSVSW